MKHEERSQAAWDLSCPSPKQQIFDAALNKKLETSRPRQSCVSAQLPHRHKLEQSKGSRLTVSKVVILPEQRGAPCAWLLQRGRWPLGAVQGHHKIPQVHPGPITAPSP